MRVIEVVVDVRPTECVGCPLNRFITKECGELRGINVDHGVMFTKIPNGKCLLKTRKK